MTDKPPKDEPGADERFNRGVSNALKMPPKLHKVKRGEKKASQAAPEGIAPGKSGAPGDSNS